MDAAQCDALHCYLLTSLDGQELFVQDCYAGADAAFRLPILVITEYAWHSLFSRNLFIVDSTQAMRASHAPQFTVIDSPRFRADPARHGTHSETVIAIHF